MKSHYDYIDKYFTEFVKHLPVSDYNKNHCKGLIAADGDKCYSYKDAWEKKGVPFNRGCAIYLVSKMHPYSDQCRDTVNGWVPVEKWVVSVYLEMKAIFESIEN